MDSPTAMGEFNLFWAIVLGALQGLAEFLPISSSGHLSLAQAWIGIDPKDAGHSFNIVLHGGTLIAVLWVYRVDLWELVKGLRPGLSQRSTKHDLFDLLLATAPLSLFVLIPKLENWVVVMEQEPRWVGGALLATGLVLFASHRRIAPADDPKGSVGWKVALFVGVAQLFAVFPGISRSGITIAAGLACGMGRARSARFSFLLSIPAVGGASLKETIDLFRSAGAVDFDPFLFGVGFFVSLAVGLLALRGLLRILQRLGMLPFVPYLVFLGLLAILIG